MNDPGVMIAAFGLGTAIHAALETELEDILARATVGSLGLVLLTLGVLAI
jgi:hypothetical protein